MTESAIQKVTTEDVKEAILTLIRENNAELKAFLGEVSSKIVDTPKKKKHQKPKSDGSITIIESEHVPYSEMAYWKANPDLKPMVLNEQNHRIAQGDFSKALKNVQEAFSDFDVTDEEWFEQIKD